MKNSCKLAIAAIVFVFAIPDQASAQITITYDAGFPKPGAVKGQIAVQGKINIPAGLVGATTGNGNLVICPVGGGVKQEFAITIAANQRVNVPWSGTAAMLGGANYNVTVEIEVKILNQTPSYNTDTKQSAPK